MIINGKQVCIHDETWKECEVRTHFGGSLRGYWILTAVLCVQGGHAPKDFIRQIEEEYNKLNQS